MNCWGFKILNFFRSIAGPAGPVGKRGKRGKKGDPGDSGGMVSDIFVHNFHPFSRY